MALLKVRKTLLPFIASCQNDDNKKALMHEHQGF